MITDEDRLGCLHSTSTQGSIKYFSVGLPYPLGLRDQNHVKPRGNAERVQLALLPFGTAVSDHTEFYAVPAQQLQSDARVLWQEAFFVVRGPKVLRKTFDHVRCKSPLSDNGCVQHALVRIAVIIKLDYTSNEVVLRDRSQVLAKHIVLVCYDTPNQLLAVI